MTGQLPIGPLRCTIGNVITPEPDWPEYVMELIADCVNVIGSIDEGWHWDELEGSMRAEYLFRTVQLMN